MKVSFLKKITSQFLCVTLGLTLLTVNLAQAQETKPLIKINTAWVVGQEGFMMWYAKKQGWDKELGIDFHMQSYSNGSAAMRDFQANTWFLGAVGALPVAIAALNGNLSVIGVANNEAQATAILVRSDSELLTKKGVNPAFPEVYGSAELLKDKMVFATEKSSSAYVMHKWLDALHVESKDVKIQNINQGLALISFKHDKGEAVSLWSPFTYLAFQDGLKIAATGKTVDAQIPVLLVANTAFAEQHPEQTKQFVALYLRAIEWFLNASQEERTPLLQEYYQDFYNQDYSEYSISLEYDNLEIFPLERQKEMFKVVNGESVVQAWQNEIIDFYKHSGVMSEKEAAKLAGSTYVTDTYLDAITPEYMINK